MQLQDALGAFQVQLAADGRSVHTRNQYQRHVAGLIAWLVKTGHSAEVADVTPGIVADFFASNAARMSARGGSKRATSANAQRTSLRCFFRWAHESGIASTNAARLLKRARCSPPPPRALHPDEQKRLLDVLAAATGPVAGRDRVLVGLLLNTGIRIGSAIALDVEDIDFDHNEITLRATKNDRPTTVIMPESIGDKLWTFLGDRTAGAVFRAGERRISQRQAQRRLARWLAAAKIRGKSAHSLRHTFATRIYSTTGDLLLTQMALGHASIASTVIYAKLDKGRLRAVVGT